MADLARFAAAEVGRRNSLIYRNGLYQSTLEHWYMTKPEEQNEAAKESKPSRLEEARRNIEQYANDLREIIKKLRRKMQ